ncbi:hypothetical protein [Rhodanobacter sp. MP1X3]|uniref:hypothetical protein n=1 Tax=Rhodanobacter sp. MP1X3 TaxID=2723086 RepID=UPI00161D908E|nr:hypothetical protein [Rhodanobacter sp. MP1X3]MBB6242879.1 hypothetical protein [Rhodanobacter sp. MP1X3]
MLNRLTAVLLFSLTLITSGCGASTMKTPDIKQNPNPKMRYEITITVHGAPKDFDTVKGSMQYEVKSSDTCVAADSISGHHSNLAQFIPFEIKKVDDHTYKGTVVTDYFLDEDYYGLGVCHWVMSSAMTVFKINGNGVDFGPGIGLSDVQGQKSVDLYFPIKTLSNGSDLSYGDGGQNLSDTVKKHRSDFFVITLSAKGVAP